MLSGRVVKVYYGVRKDASFRFATSFIIQQNSGVAMALLAPPRLRGPCFNGTL